MKVVVSVRARIDLNRQLDFLIDTGAATAARRLNRRLVSFIEGTLAPFPETGLPIHHRGLRECWVPRTRIVVWYRVSGETLEIARFWHTSQDRRPPDQQT